MEDGALLNGGFETGVKQGGQSDCEVLGARWRGMTVVQKKRGLMGKDRLGGSIDVLSSKL